ncbi:ribosome silencing factor [Membranicola marinus]|uniref:Ribosomal silencing factor RsfS n=1 Tax=Membranihabitans marinus TaxID=1227546 RepID=A0A953HYA5_9BACT|nr:ribosome silencing factor [Membranihabitans marinus]MBY5957947.1 ribosome silencing factor [Membranihabitans marinus]
MQAKLREKVEYQREELNNFIVDSLQDSKAKDIVKFDLRNLQTPPTDFFIICEADSVTHVKAIAEHVEKDLKVDFHLLPANTDGKNNATWIALDYFTTIVHVFLRETREFYNLEGLWRDAAITEYDNE